MARFRPAHALLLTLSTLLLLSAPADAAKYRCADGAITNIRSFCDNRGGLADGICGDGFIGVGEVCDEGQLNSDIQPNGCRNDCRRFWCGDGVIDSNEQCDSEYLNHAICTDFDKNGVKRSSIPDPWYWGGTLRCKDNCSYDLSGCHYCGDGVTQSPQEQCDDGNSVDDDGCNRDCTACVSLNNNIEISSDTQICTNNYNADDYGDLGVIIIKAPNVVLDCDGARLTGQGDGIGIYIKRSDNVTVRNCIIDNYEFGIYAEDSNNIRVLGMGNKMYHTTEQLVLDNSTAARAPMPEAQRLSPGMRPDRRVLAGQDLRTKTVSARAGESLKTQARSMTPPAESRRVARIPDKTDTRRELRPRPERAAPTAAPVITFPAKGERFTAPASVTARADFDRKQRIQFLLKTVPDNRIVQRSSSGRFTNIGTGSYCVSAVYAGKQGGSSACIEFSVGAGRMAPLRQERLLLHRP